MKFKKELLKLINTGNLDTRNSQLLAEDTKIDRKQPDRDILEREADIVEVP
jgi:hypothetical protein